MMYGSRVMVSFSSVRMDGGWESACVTSLPFPQNTLRWLVRFVPHHLLLPLAVSTVRETSSSGIFLGGFHPMYSQRGQNNMDNR